LSQENKTPQKLAKILADIKALANDQDCSLCKEDLELAAKGVEASAIKMGRMDALVKELETKKLTDIDDQLKAKYVGSNPTPAVGQVKRAEDLGVNEMLLDVADMLDDVKEITNLGNLLPTPPSLPGLGKTGSTPTARKRPPAFLPPLPHELLLGTRE
jgi:hypothetical protein